MMARWSVRLLGAVVAVIVVVQVVDGFGARSIRRQVERRAALVEGEASRNRQYRRPIVFGTPAEQNAAVWYRRAVERQAYSADTQVDLRMKAEKGKFLPEDVSRFSGYCREAHGRRLQDALRSVYCDWQTSYTITDEKVFESVNPVIAIADCLAVDGHGRAYVRDWRAASEAYLKVLVFGSDLGRGNDLVTAMGLGVARTGIGALSALVDSIDDGAVLDDLAEKLTRLGPSIPSVSKMLRYERLQLMDSLLSYAEQAPKLHSPVARMLIPWRVLAAMGLPRELALIEALRSDDDVSVDSIDAVIHRIQTSTRNDLLKAIVDDGTLSRQIHASDDVWRSFLALQRAVSARQRSVRR
jgi:hypothetical protein